MKNKIYFAFIIAVMLALLTANVSFADKGGQGKATPFKITFPGETTYECSGVRVTQGNGIVKDSETCIASGNTSHLVEGTIVGDPDFCTFDGRCGWRWASDFDLAIATHVTLVWTDNGDGTFTLDVVAYY